MRITEFPDELDRPLGLDGTCRKRRWTLPLRPLSALSIVLALFLLSFTGFVVFNDDPLGGEPVSSIAVGMLQARNSAGRAPSEAQMSAQRPAQGPTLKAGQKTVTIIDGTTGARQSVVVSSEPDPGDDSDITASLPPQNGIDPRLLENSRYGMIPVAASGLSSFDVYAAATPPGLSATTPLIAIVIGGVGTGGARTADAILRLPGAVSLCLTPYGADAKGLAERARLQRHEIFLQVPMEPYDFPDNDPGPKTLLTSLAPEDNVDRLAFHLSRIQGYAGIANYMGARFLATEQAVAPILREAARRGLAVFDDGSEPRSVAAKLAAAEGLHFARADLVIDALTSQNDIDRALAQLESIARQRGVAIGAATALPLSIERINAWSQGLASRGIMLVPLTTAMKKQNSSPSAATPPEAVRE